MYKKIVIAIFTIILIIPLTLFNFKTNQISTIDNKLLTEFPTSVSNFTDNFTSYVNDRIGLRDKMIKGYTLLNYQLFNKVTSPIYSKGKDDYIFGAGITVKDSMDYEYLDTFAAFVNKMKNYYEQRNIPFLFVFNPAKPVIYSDKIADGINYDRTWVKYFLNKLKSYNIKYLDNTEVLQSVKDKMPFNKQYDANHWNDYGAFIGVNNILKEMSKYNSKIHINTENEFSITKKKETSLLVQYFPINEDVVNYNMKSNTVKDITSQYSKLKMDKTYANYGYTVNNARNDGQRTLVFQGSYMNHYGYKFMQNALSSYLRIHDYQNVLNFPYYTNIYQPNYVIFETAEYTFYDEYYNKKMMDSAVYNDKVSSSDKQYKIKLDKNIIYTDKNLVTIYIKAPSLKAHAYLKYRGKTYDLSIDKDYYYVTIDKENFDINDLSGIIIQKA